MNIGSLLPLLVLLVAFWFLVIRPARARQTQARSTVARLAPGQRVMTTAGLFGRVVAVENAEVSLEIAPGVTVRYVAAAIAQIVEDPAAAGTGGEPDASITQDDTPEA